MCYYNGNLTFTQSPKAGMLSNVYQDIVMMDETWKCNLTYKRYSFYL